MRKFRQNNEQKMRDFAILEAAEMSRQEIASILQVGTSTLTRWEYFRDFITELDDAGGTFSKIRCTFEIYAARMAQGKTDTQEIMDLLADKEKEDKEKDKWEKRFANWKNSKNLRRRHQEYEEYKPEQLKLEEKRWLQRIRQPKRTPSPSVNEDIVIEIKVRYALSHILQGLHTVKDIESFCVSIENEKDFREDIRLLINDAAAVCKIRTFKLTRILRDRAQTLFKP